MYQIKRRLKNIEDFPLDEWVANPDNEDVKAIMSLLIDGGGGCC